MGTQNAVRRTPYSFHSAVAAADIEENSQVLMVICPELMPHTTNGDVAAGNMTTTTKLKTPSGTTTTADNTIVNYLTATWEGQSFCRYPPMIRRGETVEVYRLANQDKLYWRTNGRGRNFRTTDRLYMEISATATNSPNSGTNTSSTPDGEKNDDTTYSFYMDSIKKVVGFKTSMVNGEACRFAGEFDLVSGMFSISDNPDNSSSNAGESSVGNRLFMDTGAKSGTPMFQVNIGSGGTIMLKGDDGYIKIPKRFFIDVGERTVFNSPLTFINRDTSGFIFVKARSMVFDIAKDLVSNIGNVFGVNAPSSKFSGNIVAGNIRAISFIGGVVGALYKSITCSNMDSSGAVQNNNTPDADYSGSGDRHAASSEQLQQFSSLVTSLFNEVKTKVGAPADTSGLNPIATNSTITTIQGK